MRRAPLDTLAELSGEPGHRFVLPEKVAHYLVDVLRLKADEVIELFDGKGLVVRARLIEERPVASVEVEAVEEVWREVRAIALCQAIPKGDRWEWVLEKSTELGVSTIQPILSARTVVKISPSKQERKLERWTQITQSAARQSGRTHFPVVCAPSSAQDVLEASPDAVHIVAALWRETRHIREIATHVPAHADVHLWVGPEGGWTLEELEAFTYHGAYFTNLGPNVLRAETAALSLLTLAQDALGSWS